MQLSFWSIVILGLLIIEVRFYQSSCFKLSLTLIEQGFIELKCSPRAPMGFLQPVRQCTTPLESQVYVVAHWKYRKQYFKDFR